MHVEAVGAGAPDQRAIVTGQWAFGAAALKGHSTDAAVVVVGDPTPGRHSRPVCVHRILWDEDKLSEMNGVDMMLVDKQKKKEPAS